MSEKDTCTESYYTFKDILIFQLFRVIPELMLWLAVVTRVFMTLDATWLNTEEFQGAQL